MESTDMTEEQRIKEIMDCQHETRWLADEPKEGEGKKFNRVCIKCGTRTFFKDKGYQIEGWGYSLHEIKADK